MQMVIGPQVPIDTEKKLNMCFGCGRDNPIGLKLTFQRHGQIARAQFVPGESHQGWPGIVHGGIISCLLDEAMGYATYFENITCLTAKMQLRIRCTARVGEPLIITSSITRRSRRLVETRAAIALKDGTQVAEGAATMFVLQPKKGDTGSAGAKA